MPCILHRNNLLPFHRIHHSNHREEKGVCLHSNAFLLLQDEKEYLLVLPASQCEDQWRKKVRAKKMKEGEREGEREEKLLGTEMKHEQ